MNTASTYYPRRVAAWLCRMIMALAVMAATGACTRNNGDIGSKFGSWKLTEIQVDGVTDDAYSGNIFWGFQGTTLTFTTVTVTHGVPANNLVYVEWHEADGGYLVLDTAHMYGQEEYLHTPPAALMMPRAEALPLKIVSESGSHMVLAYTDDQGRAITYRLRKWG